MTDFHPSSVSDPHPFSLLCFVLYMHAQYVLGSFKSLIFPLSVDEDITHENYKGKGVGRRKMQVYTYMSGCVSVVSCW